MQYVIVDHGYSPEQVTLVTAQTLIEALKRYFKKWNPDLKNITIKLITGSS